MLYILNGISKNVSIHCVSLKYSLSPDFILSNNCNLFNATFL